MTVEAPIQENLFGFDYSILPDYQRDAVVNAAEEIKTLAKRTVYDIIRIGELLTIVKETVGHGNFGEWIDKEFGWSAETSRRFMHVYDKFHIMCDLDNIAPTSLYLLSANNISDSARDEALERAEAGEYIGVDAAKDIIHRHDRAIYSSNSTEWYTPHSILGKVSEALGGISLDPCSNSHETPNVPAEYHYTEEDDGLSQPWFGTVFMNPPYGRVIADWVIKLVDEYKKGNVIEAIALIPSRTDTRWFRELRDYPRCFVWGRIKFSKNDTPAPFPSMAVYLGTNRERFARVFGIIGDIYTRVDK